MSKAIRAKIELTNERGLHARASHKFVECASQFDAEIEVTSHNDVCAETVLADSVMELLLLGSAYGESITISGSGPEAEDAVDALIKLVSSRFGESK